MSSTNNVEMNSVSMTVVETTPNIIVETVMVDSEVEITKNKTLPEKFKKLLIFEFCLISKMIETNTVPDMAELISRQSLPFEEQLLFYTKFEEEYKDETKKFKKIIKDSNKPVKIPKVVKPKRVVKVMYDSGDENTEITDNTESMVEKLTKCALKVDKVVGSPKQVKEKKEKVIKEKKEKVIKEKKEKVIKEKKEKVIKEKKEKVIKEKKEKVVAEEIVREEIVREALVAEELVSEEIVSEEIVSEELVAEELVAEEIVAEEIVAEEIVAEEIVTVRASGSTSNVVKTEQLVLASPKQVKEKVVKEKVKVVKEKGMSAKEGMVEEKPEVVVEKSPEVVLEKSPEVVIEKSPEVVDVEYIEDEVEDSEDESISTTEIIIDGVLYLKSDEGDIYDRVSEEYIGKYDTENDRIVKE